jgi:hypothetical protein
MKRGFFPIASCAVYPLIRVKPELTHSMVPLRSVIMAPTAAASNAFMRKVSSMSVDSWAGNQSLQHTAGKMSRRSPADSAAC